VPTRTKTTGKPKAYAMPPHTPPSQLFCLTRWNFRRSTIAYSP